MGLLVVNVEFTFRRAFASWSKRWPLQHQTNERNVRCQPQGPPGYFAEKIFRTRSYEVDSDTSTAFSS